MSSADSRRAGPTFRHPIYNVQGRRGPGMCDIAAPFFALAGFQAPLRKIGGPEPILTPGLLTADRDIAQVPIKSDGSPDV